MTFFLVIEIPHLQKLQVNPIMYVLNAIVKELFKFLIKFFVSPFFEAMGTILHFLFACIPG